MSDSFYKRPSLFASFFKWVIVPFALIVSVVALLIYLAVLFVQTPTGSAFMSSVFEDTPPQVTILLFGIDATDDVQRADTIMAFHLDADRERIGALSIPRDTRVTVPGYGKTKINHAYAYGGTRLLRETVSNYLNVPMDHVIKVNVAGLARFVDALGGVMIDVPKDMNYEDKAGNLFINLKQGKQRLNGDQAIQFLRFRGDAYGDIGRILRQQMFMRALMEEVVKTDRLFQLPSIFKALRHYINSSLSLSEMMALTYRFYDVFLSDTIYSASLPGENRRISRLSYWVVDGAVKDKLVSRVLLGEVVDAEEILSDTDVASRVIERGPISFSQFFESLKIEVLNGTETVDMATGVAEALREEGFDLMAVGDAGRLDYESTLIIDWSGHLDLAIHLAHFLKIDPSNIIVYDRPDKDMDLTLILGKDWRDRKQFQKE